MWNCAKCRAEVDDGFEVCWSCGTSIDGQVDPTFSRSDAEGSVQAAQGTATEVTSPPQTLVSIATALKLERAELVRRHLEAVGIEIFVAGTSLKNGVLPADGISTLQVREADAARARTIIADMPPEPPPPPAPVADKPAAAPPASGANWEPANKADLTPREYILALESKLSGLIDEKDVDGWKVNPAFDPEVNAFIQAHANNEMFHKKARSMQQNRAKYFATMRAPGKKKVEEEVQPVATQPAEALPMADAPLPEATWLSPEEEAALDAATPPRGPMLSPRLRRLIRVAAVLLLAVLALGYMASLTYSELGDQHIKDAAARIGQSDPDWDWEELQRKRAAVKKADNAALGVEETVGAFPAPWPQRQDGWATIAAAEDAWPLTEAEVQAVDFDIENAAGPTAKRTAGLALINARFLANYLTSSGKYSTAPPRPLDAGEPDPAPVSPAQVEQVGRLLWLDSVLRTHKGKHADALSSARAALIAGRAVCDGPEFDLQRARLVTRSLASKAVGRILGQGAPEADALKETQELFEDELAQPVLRHALRGSRAWIHGLFPRSESGSTAWVLQRDKSGSLMAVNAPQGSVFLAPYDWFLRGRIKDSHAAALGIFTDAIDVLQNPTDQWPEPFADLNTRVNALEPSTFDRCDLTLPLLRDIAPLATGYVRSEAELRTAVVAIAAERYRLAFNEFPSTIQELVPKFLKTVPVDPYDGKPLRLLRQPDGLVIYSVGPDREDNQGSLANGGEDPKGKDIGVRLWTPDKRRVLTMPEKVPMPAVKGS